MKVLVTGGTGAVGRQATDRLVENGHDVTVIGRRPDMVIEGAEYKQCDILDFDCLTDNVNGMEGIVHLAAIPNPGKGTGQDIFNVNCTGTFNVYRAAANAGIHRVVSASSINALGYNFGTKRFQLSYFPMDEEHASFTTDPYSFSKQVMEEIGAYFWRRESISSIFLRLPGVYEMTEERMERMQQFRARSRQQYQDLVDMDDQERTEVVHSIIDQHDRLRAELAFESRANWREIQVRRLKKACWRNMKAAIHCGSMTATTPQAFQPKHWYPGSTQTYP